MLSYLRPIYPCPPRKWIKLSGFWSDLFSLSKQRKLLSRIGIETSNLYTGFLAIAINLLQNNGEMVVIVPRSFCNGPYFKPFSKLLLSTTAFKHIHVFGSGKKAFKEDDVLQENIILHAIKGGIKDKVLNVFHKGQKGLSKNIAYGLSIYLNSTLVDKYFCLFSGHTQVNSTDLRSLNYPPLHILESLGNKIGENYPNQHKIDSLINEELTHMADKEGFDPVAAQQKIDEALEILKALGLAHGQHNERSALTLLAILNLRPELSWKNQKDL